MYQVVGENNKVNYGSIDEPIDWNVDQFKLYDFFNKEIKGLKKKWAYHQFNYIGFLNKNFFIGLATVNLGYADNVFAFFYDMKEGIKYNFNTIKPKKLSKLIFPKNPDEYITEFKTGKHELVIMKSHNKGTLEIHGNFDSKLIINAIFPFSLKDKPLRVLNPSEPTRFTFTEKFSPLIPSEIDICLNGKSLSVTNANTTGIFDWSGGFLRRETNWYWSSLGGESTDGRKVGANFAALVNESFFPENAYWIDGERTRVSRLIYNFNINDPYQTWEIYDEDKEFVNLTFTANGEQGRKINLMPISKIFFRQFLGEYNGWLKDSKGNKVVLESFSGFAEYHRSIW